MTRPPWKGFVPSDTSLAETVGEETRAARDHGRVLHRCYLCGELRDCSVLTVVNRLRFAVLRCNHCALVFTSSWPVEQPTHAQFDSAAPTEVAEYWTDEAIERELGLFIHYRREARDYLEMLARSNASGRLIDVGCSLGVFLDEARRSGFEVTGVEPSSRAARFARETFGIHIRPSTLDASGFASESFDVAVLLDVIEHQLDPVPMLKAVSNLVRPGGWVLIETPNTRSLHAWLFRFYNDTNNVLRRATGGRWDHPWNGYYSFEHSHLWQSGHVVHFSSLTLDLCAHLAGLRPVEHRFTFSDTRYLVARSKRLLSLTTAVIIGVQWLARALRRPNKLVSLYCKPN